MRASTDVTVYRKKYDVAKKDYTWARIVIKKASWFSGKHSSLSSSKYDKYTVRIFMCELAHQFFLDGAYIEDCETEFVRTESMKDSAGFYVFDDKGRLDIKEGDVFVMGAVDFDSPSLARENTPYYEVFNVVSVTANKMGTVYMHHYKIAGM